MANAPVFEWDKMDPRERDLLVAEAVMGQQFRSEWYKRHVDTVACYTEDISAAWLVVEKMGDCLHLRQHGQEWNWTAEFCGFPNSESSADSAPEAICLAALRACGVQIVSGGGAHV